MKRIRIVTLAAVLTLNFTLCLSVHAQLDPDPGGTGGGILTTTQDPDPSEDLAGEPPAPGNDVPVDGGLSLLLAAGAAYGARKLRRRSPGKDEQTD